MATVVHHQRAVNRSLSNTSLAANAPLAVASIPFTGHTVATLRRTIFSFRLGARILSGGGTPPPPEWIQRVFPFVTVQFDPASTANTAADPATGDARILQAKPLRKVWRGASTSAELYAVDYFTDGSIDTDVQRKGTGTGTNYSTVTAFLWTYDADVYWGGTFYDHRGFDWQAELSVIFTDSF